MDTTIAILYTGSPETEPAPRGFVGPRVLDFLLALRGVAGACRNYADSCGPRVAQARAWKFVVVATHICIIFVYCRARWAGVVQMLYTCFVLT